MAAEPVASSSAMPMRFPNARARMLPAASSIQAHATTRSLPSGGPSSASTAAGPGSCSSSHGGPQAGRADTNGTSPSQRTPTSPAGTMSDSTRARSRAISHAAPTDGCPAKSSSTAGVWMRIAPRAASSTKTVSLNPRSAATA